MTEADYILPEIATTADGSETLVCPLTGDTYHSVNGAVAESRHIFIENGVLALASATVSVLEIGFGSGLNAYLTASEAHRSGLRVDYTSIELNPVSTAALSRTAYWDDPLFRMVHECRWEVPVSLTKSFRLEKLHRDFVNTVFDAIFDIVYFDAFAPDTQPRMWMAQMFRKLYGSLRPGGFLVTYSAKGDVKRAMREAGFEVKRLPGAPGKRHMLRATRPA